MSNFEKKSAQQQKNPDYRRVSVGLHNARRVRERKEAVALEYAPVSKSSAPVIIGQGTDEVAARLLREAEKLGIPIRHDGDLLTLLSLCDIGDEIPLEAFVAVAEILRAIYAHKGPPPIADSQGADRSARVRAHKISQEQTSSDPSSPLRGQLI